MTFTPWKYQAQCNKMYHEGFSDALARVHADEQSKKYWGDDRVAKFQKHDGSFTYCVKEEIIEEMLKYMLVLREVVETVYGWENIHGTPKELAKKDVMFVHFVNGLRPNKEVLESLVKCYKGSPMMSFFRDKVAEEIEASEEACRQAVRDLWTF